ncbi:hypothetical protein LWI29_015105 [Acer saccharum]|uniref:Uncharacterized protein n=1 Tax=Acer saccharum TaxID=4024 RepID=A0AA39TG88_ACESA|nr:hypothetical protein LWI29_015105 [Acer saccharum]
MVTSGTGFLNRRKCLLKGVLMICRNILKKLFCQSCSITIVPEPQSETFVACKSSNGIVSLSLVDSERPLEMERHDVSFVLYKFIEAKIGVDVDLV